MPSTETASFATVDDLEARWRPLSEAEAERAVALLSDASAILRTEMRGRICLLYTSDAADDL